MGIIMLEYIGQIMVADMKFCYMDITHPVGMIYTNIISSWSNTNSEKNYTTHTAKWIFLTEFHYVDIHAIIKSEIKLH